SRARRAFQKLFRWGLLPQRGNDLSHALHFYLHCISHFRVGFGVVQQALISLERTLVRLQGPLRLISLGEDGTKFTESTGGPQPAPAYLLGSDRSYREAISIERQLIIANGFGKSANPQKLIEVPRRIFVNSHRSHVGFDSLPVILNRFIERPWVWQFFVYAAKAIERFGLQW